jgi:ribonucleoside-diphosphate reductase alpha chain
MAWLRGLKTTYYLRALGATTAEKSTITTGTLNKVSSAHVETTEAAVTATATGADADLNSGFETAAPVPLACSIDNPDCEACQ